MGLFPGSNLCPHYGYVCPIAYAIPPRLPELDHTESGHSRATGAHRVPSCTALIKINDENSRGREVQREMREGLIVQLRLLSQCTACVSSSGVTTGLIPDL